MNSTNDMDQITDNLWLGNYKSANNTQNLKSKNINKILCVMTEKFPIYNKYDNLNQKIIKVSDIPTANIIKYFGESINFIEGNNNVLVHCMQGASRSATIVIAYIMWKQKLSFENAFNFVNKKRPVAFPNFGFREQLKIFDKLLIENKNDLNKIDFNNIKKHGKSEYFEW